MSQYINRNPTPDGDPNGIIYAPNGALFFKTGSFYVLNTSGSSGGNWQDVFFRPTSNPFIFRTEQDIALLTRIETGSFLYIKTTDNSYNTGWKFVSNKTPFIHT